MDHFLIALYFMLIFYFFDGVCWILLGHLIASGDTKYIFYVNLVVNTFGYIVPMFFFVGIAKGGGDIAWTIIAFYSLCMASCFFYRYRSGRWLLQVVTD